MKRFAKLIGILTLVAALPMGYANATVIDPANDFLASYTGPKTGDMDVLSANVGFDGTSFILTATLNGLIGTTANTLYVFGFDKGGATNHPFPDAPNVIFNAVVAVNGTTGAVTATGGGVGSSVISGNTLTATIAAALLPSTGLAFQDYLWNLWPRAAAAVGGAQPIPDFAPNNAMVKVAVPEPASLAIFGLGLAGLGWVSRRRAITRK